MGCKSVVVSWYPKEREVVGISNSRYATLSGQALQAGPNLKQPSGLFCNGLSSYTGIFGGEMEKLSTTSPFRAHPASWPKPRLPASWLPDPLLYSGQALAKSFHRKDSSRSALHRKIS